MERTGEARIGTKRFRAQLVVFGSGERSNILVDCRTNLPVFHPTVWTISRYRERSASTIEQALRAASLVHIFCEAEDIDLDRRFRDGIFLSIREVEGLVALVRKPMAEANDPSCAAVRVPDPETVNRRNASSRSPRHMRTLPSAKRKRWTSLNNQTIAIRIHYIVDYLKFRASEARARLATITQASMTSQPQVATFDARLEKFVGAILARQPSGGGKGRVALTPEQREALLETVHPDSPMNPWREPFVRQRNRLIILWLLATGMRRGELLSARIKAIRFASGCVELKRTHDDKRDPRRRQPVAKRQERLAPLDDDLIDLTQSYMTERSRIAAAKRHGFLFVAEDGAPLSLSSIDALFASLRDGCPAVGPASAHVLRHTWNEDFSAYAEEVGMKPADEDEMRRDLMGWSLASRMPAVYGRRRTMAKASEHSKSMQRRMLRLAGIGGPSHA